MTEEIENWMATETDKERIKSLRKENRRIRDERRSLLKEYRTNLREINELKGE